MPRFVILRHQMPDEQARRSHWDLMLELETGKLATWALPTLPTTEQTVPASRLPDHRRAYLDYEGPVSGDRGVVSRWDGGSYRAVHCTEQAWTVELNGSRWRGTVYLRAELSDEAWSLRWVSEEFPEPPIAI